MAIAEIFLTAFIAVLFEKLASSDLIRLARSAGIYSELIKWNNILTQIQAVLVDAGHKHVREKYVQLWLNKLQQLAYDIDDVLDDLATEAMQRQLNQESYARASKKNLLGLNDNVERSSRTTRRLEETSLVDESKIIGRDGDKEALLGKLLVAESCSQNVSVLSIVGLGG